MPGMSRNIRVAGTLAHTYCPLCNPHIDLHREPGQQGSALCNTQEA